MYLLLYPMKKCYLSFEISSEDMLEIEPQPADTCDNNHPLFNSMDYNYSDLRVAIEDAPHTVTSIRSFKYDPENVDNLQTAIDSFDSWANGWIEIYKTYIKPEVSELENHQFKLQAERIKELLSHHEYKDFCVHSAIGNLESCISDIESGIENAHHCYSEHQDNLVNLRNQIQSTQTEIESEDDENEIEYLEDAIIHYQSELDALEDSEPWENYMDDATRALVNYENIYNHFGNTMQQHYTELRNAVSQFKTMTKHYIEELQQKKAINVLLPYPEDYLATQMKEHSKKDETVVAATPSIFIKRVRELEADVKVLDDDEHELLMHSDMDEYVLPIAMKRFKHEFPDYQRLLTFDNLQEAITLGKRRFLPLNAPQQEREHEYSDHDVAMS